MIVGFPPGTLLTQLSSSGDVAGGNRAFHRLLVHGATTSLSTAQSTANDPNPVNRLIYVNTTPPAGGGAIELVVPSGGWVMYGDTMAGTEPRQSLPPTPSFSARAAFRCRTSRSIARTAPMVIPIMIRLSPSKCAAALIPTPASRSSLPDEGNVSNLTYAINIPVVTNAPFDILVRSDASTSNTLVKLDGGIDLNSQMGLGPTSVPPAWRRRISSTCATTRPAMLTTVFSATNKRRFSSATARRNSPRETLSATTSSRSARRRIITPSAARTRSFPAPALAQGITNQTANWVYHDPGLAP